MILVCGFNVYPNEVEDVVAQMPGVLEVRRRSACRTRSRARRSWLCGRARTRPSPRTTCAPTASANLTGYKRPQTVEFRDDLPKTNVGKILRRMLKEEVTRPGAR